MRGVIPCTLLAKIAELLKAQGDERPFIDHFDLVAGTSTGGLIALALASPLSSVNLEGDQNAIPSYAFKTEKQCFLDRIRRKEPQMTKIGLLPPTVGIEVIHSLYRTYGKKIFPKRQSKLFGAIFIDKYDEKPLEEFLDEKFGDTPLEKAIIPTVLVSYDVAGGGRPYLFDSTDSHGFLMKEAARATSAAPTYFHPYFTKDRETGENLSLLDGGVVASNPVMYAYRTARKLYPDCNRFHILSLSTGKPELQFQINKNTGVIGWLDPSQGAPIQKVYATSIAQAADEYAHDNPQISYTRIESELKQRYKMDVTTPEAIDEMEQEALSMFSSQIDALTDYVKLLAKRNEFNQLKLESLAPMLPKEGHYASETTGA